MSRILKAGAVGCACMLVLGASAAAAPIDRGKLKERLDRLARKAGSDSGVRVARIGNGGGTERLYGRRADRRRVLASNTKLFTTVAALAGPEGPDARIPTRVYLGGPVRHRTLQGDLYLVGGGDPALNRAKFGKAGVPHTSIKPLAKAVKGAGIHKVGGRIYADDSAFDRVRGVPYSNWQTTSQIGGPLGALTYDSARAGGDPALATAAILRKKLRKAGVKVKRNPRLGRLPGRLAGRAPAGQVLSPTITELVEWTNERSDNFFAEMLAKWLPTAEGRKGTTRNGTKLIRRHARRTGTDAKLADGSGLSSGNLASPAEVTGLLTRTAGLPLFDRFYRSLPRAGREGTLADRMGGSPAAGRCRAKTGTLDGVSTLSGYCRRAGRLTAFSILMNRVDVTRARTLQDKMVKTIARYK